MTDTPEQREMRIKEILYQWECYKENPNTMPPTDLTFLKAQAAKYGVELKND